MRTCSCSILRKWRGARLALGSRRHATEDIDGRIEGMRKNLVRAKLASMISIGVLALVIAPAEAQNRAQGNVIVDGKSVAIAQVYAYAEEGYADEKKLDVVVLLCDVPVPAAAIRNGLARGELVEAGKLTCVRQIINSDKIARDSEVRHVRFGHRPPRGYTSEQVFDAKTLDAKTIAGRSYTTATQKSFEGVPYSYDITFSATIVPKE
jgi:hypothetical protein